MSDDIKNFRIRFYGVQGSGSIFPARAERGDIRDAYDKSLLEAAFLRLQEHRDSKTDDASLEALLGGDINLENLKKFRQQLSVDEPDIYGGWTSCFLIETADDHTIVLDCGSGFRLCSQYLEEKWGEANSRHLTILGSHAHFDHTEGFDQSSVCFDSRNHIHVMSNRSYLKALDSQLGIFTHYADREQLGRQTPLTYELMPANFIATEIRDLKANPAAANDDLVDHFHDINEPIVIGKTTIQAFPTFHPDPCLAYRIEHGGKVFIYCTDHELRHGPNPEHPLQIASIEAEKHLTEMSMDADVLYRDGQFLRSEYEAEKTLGGPNGVPRRDWGHSCIEDVVAMATKAKVKNTYIGHHDPNRRWSELQSIDQMLGQHSDATGLHVELAKAETVIDL